MEINMTKEIHDKTLITHIVLHCMTTAIVNELTSTRKENEDLMVDVRLTINNHEVNLKSFMDHWQSQISRMIKEKADEFVQEKMGNITDLLYDLETRLKDEIRGRLDDWEKSLPDEEIFPE